LRRKVKRRQISKCVTTLVANFGAFKPAAFFQIDDAADRAVPKVSFS
jgi:hypothetical protein